MEPDALNAFLRGHAVVQISRELYAASSGPAWLLLIEYLDGAAQNESRQKKSERVDYKTILAPDDFAVFSKLRETRKKVAEEKGLPVYAVFTNEQLAEIARQRPASEADLKKIDGIGESRCASFGSVFLELIAAGNGNASDRIPF